MMKKESYKIDETRGFTDKIVPRKGEADSIRGLERPASMPDHALLCLLQGFFDDSIEARFIKWFREEIIKSLVENVPFFCFG